MSEDLKVFMLLMNPQGKLEDIDLGSLYVNIDDNGFIHELTVEPYLGPSGLDDYEALFDCFNQEVPEVPMSIRPETSRVI